MGSRFFDSCWFEKKLIQMLIKYKRFYQRIFSVPDGKYVNIAL